MDKSEFNQVVTTASVESIGDPFCTSVDPKIVTYEDVMKAKETICTPDGIQTTPCFRSRLSDICGMEIYLKAENFLPTGAFKERGARYSMQVLSSEQKEKGVIAASSGNHSQGVSYHGMKLGIPITVVMPVIAPLMKIEKCRKYKANVLVQGNNIAEAKKIAIAIGREQGMFYINGYDHPDVIAGQGTVALEILEQIGPMDAIICPVGGGGLIAGVSVVIKHDSPNTEIIGVEAENCPGFTAALIKGYPTVVKHEATIADGLAVPKVGHNAISTTRGKIDRMLTVSEELINVAILHMIENEKIVAEGGGASPLAALFTGKLKHLKGKKVCLIVSGGNIDTTVLGRALELGLAILGRYIKFSVYVSDRPGGVADLISTVSKCGVTIKHMNCERAWVKKQAFSVKVRLMVETKDIDNAIEVRKAVECKYDISDFSDFPNPCKAKAYATLL